MKFLNSRMLFYILLSLWFILDLIQASYTGIIFDEAYYFSWGQHLDWGYFDHPPLVAVLTYLGNLFFEGPLSVRFFTALLHAFAVLFIWKTIDNKHKKNNRSVFFFFGIAFTLPMFSVYGFITAPDSVLLFFFAFTVWAFRNFIERKNTIDILWLTIGASGMILSKYHAFLILLLALLAYVKILKDKRIWIVLVFTLLIITPHFIWLYENDFITFRYHVFERSKSFKIKYLLEFLAGQLGIFNPYYLILFLVIMYKKPIKTDFKRVMRFIALGTMFFFILMLARGRVEAHWTTLVSVPMLFFVFPYFIRYDNKKPRLKYIIGGIVVLVLFTRTLILLNKLPFINFKESNIEHYQKMNAFVNQKPVVFIGSFQEAASYNYATQKAPHTNKAFYKKRKTQFDLWGWEKKFVGKPVFISPRTPLLPTPKHSFENETFKGWFVDYFQDSRLIDVKYNIETTTLIKEKNYNIKLEILNTSTVDYDFKSLDMPLQVNIAFIGKDLAKAQFVHLPLNSLTLLKAGEAKVLKTCFLVPENLKTQKYNIDISILSKLGLTTNSEQTLVKVEKQL